MKHRIRIKRKDGIRQRYWVGRKNYGSRYMPKRELNKLISKREKEGITVIPINEGFMFYNPKTREAKDIFESKRKNYGATFEIKPVYHKPGKKTQLLLLREDIEENLNVPDIPENRKIELKERLEGINQQIKRRQGYPPIESVKGEFPSVIKLGLLQRYKGTSSRRPAFVEEMNLPLKEIIPLNKERLRQTAREHFGIKKGMDILSEKSLAEAVKGKDSSQISIKDLKKYKRMNFGSLPIRKEDWINFRDMARRRLIELEESLKAEKNEEYIADLKKQIQEKKMDISRYTKNIEEEENEPKGDIIF